MANRQEYNVMPTGFFEERERGKQQISREAAQATAIAESLGYYTPQLQSIATRPLAQNTDIASQLIGAPVRGLGKLFGSERMQQVGAEQPFNLGQAQQDMGFRMPQFPAGVPPEVQSQLTAIAQQMGLGPPMQRETVPNVPSETSAQPLMRTKGQRELEDKMKLKVWDKILEKYQTETERQKAQAELEAAQSLSTYRKALSLEALSRAARGPSITQSQLIYNEMVAKNKERAAKGQDPLYPSDIARLWKVNTSTPNRMIEMYEYAKKNNMLPVGADGKKQTLQEFTRGVKFAGGDMLGKIWQEFFRSDAIYQFEPEQWPSEIGNLYEAWGDLVMKYNKEKKQDVETKEDEKTIKRYGYLPIMNDMPIPQELLAQEVTEADIQQLMEDEGVERGVAIQMYLEFLKEISSLKGGRVNAPSQSTPTAK